MTAPDRDATYQIRPCFDGVVHTRRLVPCSGVGFGWTADIRTGFRRELRGCSCVANTATRKYRFRNATIEIPLLLHQEMITIAWGGNAFSCFIAAVLESDKWPNHGFHSLIRSCPRYAPEAEVWFHESWLLLCHDSKPARSVGPKFVK